MDVTVPDDDGSLKTEYFRVWLAAGDCSNHDGAEARAGAVLARSVAGAEGVGDEGMAGTTGRVIIRRTFLARLISRVNSTRPAHSCIQHRLKPPADCTKYLNRFPAAPSSSLLEAPSPQHHIQSPCWLRRPPSPRDDHYMCTPRSTRRLERAISDIKTDRAWCLAWVPAAGDPFRTVRRLGAIERRAIAGFEEQGLFGLMGGDNPGPN